MAVELGRDKLTGAVDSHHQIRQGLALWSNTDTFKLDTDHLRRSKETWFFLPLPTRKNKDEIYYYLFLVYSLKSEELVNRNGKIVSTKIVIFGISVSDMTC